MKYASAYRVPPTDDRGSEDLTRYLCVNCVGYYEFDETFRPTHRPDGRFDYYLSYNHFGNMIVRNPSGECSVGAGQIFIYRPYEEQYYGQADGNMIENYWVHFTGFGIPGLFDELLLTGQNVLTVGVNYKLTVLFTDLIDIMTEKKPFFETAASSLLLQILLIAAAATNSPLNSLHPAAPERFHLSRQYIHRNYSKKIEVRSLASMECLSYGGYYAQFKKTYGVSPQQYLINYRLDKSIELMLNTALSIQQIAHLTGFEDPLYFSRLFKKYKAISPQQFCRNIRSPASV